MSPAEMNWLGARWELFSHAHQRPPDKATNGAPWQLWLLIGGRGAGKTRAGAEWIRAQALGLQPFADRPVERIALVGETEHDVREVMIEGVSGLLAIHEKRERPQWIPSRKRLEWANGAVAYAFSADDPESLRGPQFVFAILHQCCGVMDPRLRGDDSRGRCDVNESKSVRMRCSLASKQARCA